jgi:hypothetical protein
MRSMSTRSLWTILAALFAGIAPCFSDEPDSQAGTIKSTDSAPVEVQSVFRPVSAEKTGKTGKTKLEKQSSKPVTAHVYPQYDQLERGGRMLIAVELTMEDHWHVNANPAKPDFLVPTEVQISSPQKVKVKRILYPKPQTLRVKGSSEPYEVYGNGALIFVQVETAPDEKASAATLEIRLSLQACNESECMAPEEIVLNGRIPVAASGTPLKKTHSEKFAILQKDSQRSKPDLGKKEIGSQPRSTAQ